MVNVQKVVGHKHENHTDLQTHCCRGAKEIKRKDRWTNGEGEWVRRLGDGDRGRACRVQVGPSIPAKEMRRANPRKIEAFGHTHFSIFNVSNIEAKIEDLHL